MLPTATIVFREILEVALVLTIIMVATRGLENRNKLILSGLAIGVLGAAIIAFFTDTISDAVDGVGQEIFNAIIMFIAVGFLSWTVLWMKKHGRTLAQDLQKVGNAVSSGKQPKYVIVSIVAIATFREGAEIVLFTYGMMASGSFTITSIATGAVIGAIGGAVVGAMFYFGLLKAAKRHIFTITSWLLMLLTAGLAAKGASYLIAADVLPAIIPQVWNTSAILSGGSIVGETLSVLIGYTPRPSAMELIFYAATLLSLTVGYKLIDRRKTANKSVQAKAV